eukprot:GHVT01013913.1.p1 GENE.GHVT01013913.1~~GHVT01013913.1.p1  ORF type:complete len:756 (+),score=108.27 GHVT01013913.1:3453-5720(+)
MDGASLTQTLLVQRGGLRLARRIVTPDAIVLYCAFLLICRSSRQATGRREVTGGISACTSPPGGFVGFHFLATRATAAKEVMPTRTTLFTSCPTGRGEWPLFPRRLAFELAAVILPSSTNSGRCRLAERHLGRLEYPRATSKQRVAWPDLPGRSSGCLGAFRPRKPQSQQLANFQWNYGVAARNMAAAVLIKKQQKPLNTDFASVEIMGPRTPNGSQLPRLTSLSNSKHIGKYKTKTALPAQSIIPSACYTPARRPKAHCKCATMQLDVKMSKRLCVAIASIQVPASQHALENCSRPALACAGLGRSEQAPGTPVSRGVVERSNINSRWFQQGLPLLGGATRRAMDTAAENWSALYHHRQNLRPQHCHGQCTRPHVDKEKAQQVSLKGHSVAVGCGVWKAVPEASANVSDKRHGMLSPLPRGSDASGILPGGPRDWLEENDGAWPCRRAAVSILHANLGGLPVHQNSFFRTSFDQEPVAEFCSTETSVPSLPSASAKCFPSSPAVEFAIASVRPLLEETRAAIEASPDVSSVRFQNRLLGIWQASLVAIRASSGTAPPLEKPSALARLSSCLASTGRRAIGRPPPLSLIEQKLLRRLVQEVGPLFKMYLATAHQELLQELREELALLLRESPSFDAKARVSLKDVQTKFERIVKSLTVAPFRALALECGSSATTTLRSEAGGLISDGAPESETFRRNWQTALRNQRRQRLRTAAKSWGFRVALLLLRVLVVRLRSREVETRALARDAECPKTPLF